MITLSMKSHHAGIGTIALTVLCSFASVADAQQVTVKPMTDIGEVMTEHAAIGKKDLWTGYVPEKIPVAVCDRVRAWLFFNPVGNLSAAFTFRMLRFTCCVSHVAKSEKN